MVGTLSMLPVSLVFHFIRRTLHTQSSVSESSDRSTLSNTSGGQPRLGTLVVVVHISVTSMPNHMKSNLQKVWISNVSGF